MKHTAQRMAQFGRNGDDHLLHVSGDELRSIAALGAPFGAKMSTNPKTGLPEAFDFKDALKIAALGAATYMTGGLLAPYTTAALGGMGLGAGAAATGGSALASGLAGAGISKLANPEMSTEQALMNGVAGAVTGGALDKLGGVAAQFGAPAPDMLTAAGDAAAREAAGQSAVAAGMPEAVGLGAPTEFSSQMIQPYGVMDGLKAGMQQPGEFASHMATKGMMPAAQAMIGAGMYNLDSPLGEESGDYGGEYTIHDVFGSPLVDREGSAEDSFIKARKVKYADGGTVEHYASGGRAVDPKRKMGKGVDRVPAMIDGRQPARLDSGEYVMTRKAVQNAGGPRAMDAIHQRLKRGGIGSMK